ncbi:inovirus Gp2 family protein [Pseudomonas sp. RTB3]|uniref:inovirus Gp2 family protein n=1 Tax=unclassified Pseudomonas TaxID=196821 RepID=UPI002B235F9A|nr:MULTISPECIES: inovirus Gp2 family protein [unclassified Pseudomonas]MEB0007261.1 inovirus Gp2 family protein [Pseudomonas sp. RTB2]MEB0019444.1 inovirus Gp2 family protein [Pseudomonas sp. RTB3]MEB0270399.1 inovirus Gp2 family protein [Pseudomonas sp. 5B4]
MRRHPGNSNLHLHTGDTFQGLPLQVNKGPFIREYLSRLNETMDRALAQYPRVFAFRFDLRLPVGVQLPDYAYTNEVIDRFIESFKAKIKHNRRMARLLSKYAHDSNVRYLWTRECGQHGTPHHHLVILLNYDAFNTLGYFTSGRENIFTRLEDAWASALGLPAGGVKGLVEVPRNPTYRLDRGVWEGQAEFFFRSSYLCKAATKVFGDGSHGCGASRI